LGKGQANENRRNKHKGRPVDMGSGEKRWRIAGSQFPDAHVSWRTLITRRRDPEMFLSANKGGKSGESTPGSRVLETT